MYVPQVIKIQYNKSVVGISRVFFYLNVSARQFNKGVVPLPQLERQLLGAAPPALQHLRRQCVLVRSGVHHHLPDLELRTRGLEGGDFCNSRSVYDLFVIPVPEQRDERQGLAGRQHLQLPPK